ncbi:hypothetical protein Syun_004797 [Stephania yunnanensis]|uniref:BHLH domain-containing protein n=1 Tax=Stephania yunnanensis TaxID=152371 RepID=A0AAP0L4M5_9MAGN
MALEAVVYPNDLFNYSCKDLYSLASEDVYNINTTNATTNNNNINSNSNSYDFEVKEEEDKSSSHINGGSLAFLEQHQHQYSLLINNINNTHLYSSSSSSSTTAQHLNAIITAPSNTTPSCSSPPRRKRRRYKSSKNKEEAESQRMTHIFVERNRRKQMNDYLSILRSLMPPSYVQRSDQASIVGGAINFLKELEQLQQSLQAQKRLRKPPADSPGSTGSAGSLSDFTNPAHFPNLFTFPHYNNSAGLTQCGNSGESMADNRSGVANIEVTKVESHASVKIVSKRRPKQLLRMVVEFQKLRLTILHLTVTTVDRMVHYSFSVKVEEECQLTSVDEISMAVYQMLDRINEESGGGSDH